MMVNTLLLLGKYIVYMVGLFFLGAVTIAIMQGVIEIFDKYVFGQSIWMWWIAGTLLGGVVYYFFKTLILDHDGSRE